MVYQLKISLDELHPPIWRRVLVSPEINLFELHHIIQVAMGWENYHLFQFINGPGEYIGIPEDDGWSQTVDARTILLKDTLTEKGDHILYEYDFGDSWSHTILLEQKVPKHHGISYPYCADGKRNCPPEDCGGVFGYERILEILGDKKHEEYEETQEWMEDDFDPEDFDMEGTNLRLKNIQKYIQNWEEDQ